jgi:hypothetical protein
MSVRAGLFRPDVFSQNEVELIADCSLSQLDLVDAFAEDEIADLTARWPRPAPPSPTVPKA